MKRALRWLLAFLERKFPDRVVLTPQEMRDLVAWSIQTKFDFQALQSDFKEVLARVSAMEGGGTKVKEIEADLVKINGEINKFNFAMGFAVPQVRPGQAGTLER